MSFRCIVVIAGFLFPGGGLPRDATRCREGDVDVQPAVRPDVSGDRGVVRVGGNIRAPKHEFRINPEYPFSLQGTGTSGQVVVRGKIDIDGSMKDLAVVEAAHPDFAQSAIDAVSEWIFEPTLLNGRPVETNITVNLYYTAR